MRLVWPYIDERKQVIFVELENDFLHNSINGLLLALLVFGPIALATPRPI